MNLTEAKKFLNSKGYHLIDEATSPAVKQKVKFAETIRDEFGGKTELTDEEFEQLKSYDPSTIVKWIYSSKAEEFFDRADQKTIYVTCRTWNELREKKSREAERLRYETGKYERIKSLVNEKWPVFKEKILSKLLDLGCELKKTHPWSRFYEADSFIKYFPDGKDFDPDVPDEVTLSINNGVDTFYFEMPVSLKSAHIGNYSALRRLGEYSNGKAKNCIKLAEYQNENRNTWNIPYEIFLPAMEEFANAKDYLTDEEIEKIKRSRASSDAFEAGASEFYRTAKYQGD